jgi:4-hydroxybenzoate polyprenyltransferase
MNMLTNLPHYIALMRFERPIGWLLLLWPTLWALWIAADGNPDGHLVWVFTLGVIVMRSAGCVINDLADRDIDPQVERTKNRPLADDALNVKQGLGLLFVLLLLAVCLLLLLPMRVWPWSLPALALTVIYPFMKRFIDAPQLVLGLAFSFSIPMVYVAVDKSFDWVLVCLMLCNILWVLAFDTMYAMSDKEDDLKIGVKSTAIWFGDYDRHVVGLLQLSVLAFWLVLSSILELSTTFYFALFLAALLFVYQQWLIRERDRQACFLAFINNGWLGGVIWFGLILAF